MRLLNEELTNKQLRLREKDCSASISKKINGLTFNPKVLLNHSSQLLLVEFSVTLSGKIVHYFTIGNMTFIFSSKEGIRKVYGCRITKNTPCL